MVETHGTASLVIAADIGGTLLRAAIVDADGRILARHALPNEPARGIEHAQAQLISLFDRLIEEHRASVVEAIGIASAGPIDPTDGTYRHPPNLPGWHGHSMRDGLRTRYRVPVVFGHDATLAALAETRFGTHRGSEHLVYLTIGTGIGAGIVAHGATVTGAHGGAGEAGHMIVRPDGPQCGAGCSGCLEALASGSGIAAATRRAVAAGTATSLGADATALDVFAAADAGDSFALGLIADVVDALAIGLANLLAVLDPEVILLGGGVVDGLRPRWPSLLAATKAHALPRYAGGVPIEPSALGSDANLLGAAAIALGAASHARP